MSQSPDDLNFSIDSRLLEELGENLVTRNHVAVAELIKNAYDADATKVDLKFINARQNKESHNSEIQIEDNGAGMTFEEIDENWMRIGTTDKIRNPTTDEYARKKTGNKGIGRFSCRRLARRLKLTSTAEDPDSDGYVRTHVDFRWGEFARETDVDNIDVPFEREYLDEATTGVTLRLIDLRDKWTQRDFNTLRRNVLTLSVVQPQRREGAEKEDPGFEIEFDAPEFEGGQGSLLDQVYQAGWCTLEGEFDEEGNIQLELEAKRIGNREYTIRDDYEGIENTSFRIAFIPLEKKHFRDPNTLSLERAKEITSDFGGIRVYQDGFRVYPYGGPDDDWLGIDRYYTRRITKPDDEFEGLSNDLELHSDRVMLVHPRNENLVGRINVASDANLEMKADREGFIDGETFEDLKEGVRLSLQWLTLQYSNYKALKAKEELEEKSRDLQDQLQDKGSNKSKEEDSSGTSSDHSGGSVLDSWNNSKVGGSGPSAKSKTSSSSGSTSSSSSTSTSEAVNQAVTVIQSASENISEEQTGTESNVSEVVETAAEVVQQSVEQQQQEIDFYRSAFSVNQFIFSFMHELRDMILKLETAKGDVKHTAENLPEEEKNELEKVAGNLDSLKSRFEQQMNLFGILTDSGEDATKEKQRLQGEVEEITQSVEYISTSYNIDIGSDIPVNLYTPPMHQTELYSILINLLTNSIKAVIAGGSDDRRILINGDKSRDGDVIIEVLDTGIGLPEGYRNEVFDPLVTDPADELYDNLSDEMPKDLSSQLGTGSGLGLSIVSDIAQKYGGGVRFIEREGWATAVEVTLSEQ